MSRSVYTVNEAAELCRLHPRTIVRKIREGEIKAHKIGRQYRMSHEDLETFMGVLPDKGFASETSGAGPVLVSSVVDMDGISREESQRITNTLMAAMNSEHSSSSRVDFLYYEELRRLKIVINSDLERTSRILKVLEVFAQH